MFCIDKIWCDRRFLILCPLFVILQIAKFIYAQGSCPLVHPCAKKSEPQGPLFFCAN